MPDPEYIDVEVDGKNIRGRVLRRPAEQDFDALIRCGFKPKELVIVPDADDPRNMDKFQVMPKQGDNGE